VKKKEEKAPDPCGGGLFLIPKAYSPRYREYAPGIR